jgi:hypothetical protein
MADFCDYSTKIISFKEDSIFIKRLTVFQERIYALLKYYTANIGSYLPTFRDKLSSPDSPRIIRETFPTQLLTDYI